MAQIFKIIIFLSLVSCGSFKKNLMLGAISGAVIGGVGGSTFSPDVESNGKNTFVFGLLGAGVGVGLAYLLDDTRPKTQAPMILDDEIKKASNIDIPLFNNSQSLHDIKPEVKFNPVKKYEVPLEKLPPELEGKVKKQYIIEYETPAQTIEVGNRTIEISPIKSWEHTYEH